MRLTLPAVPDYVMEAHEIAFEKCRRKENEMHLRSKHIKRSQAKD